MFKFIKTEFGGNTRRVYDDNSFLGYLITDDKKTTDWKYVFNPDPEFTLKSKGFNDWNVMLRWLDEYVAEEEINHKLWHDYMDSRDV